MMPPPSQANIKYKKMFEQNKNTDCMVNELLKQFKLPADRNIQSEADKKLCWNCIMELSEMIVEDIDMYSYYYNDEKKEIVSYSISVFNDEIERKQRDIFVDETKHNNAQMYEVIKHALRPLVKEIARRLN